MTIPRDLLRSLPGLRSETPDPWAAITAHAAAAFDQTAFRFRNDDGTETSATWQAAANTTITQMTGTTFRLRLVVQETAGGSLNNNSWQLQRRINPVVGVIGEWVNVDTASAAVRGVTSPNVADGTPTTDLLAEGTGAFATADVSADGYADVNKTSFAGNDHTEVEFILRLDAADLDDGDAIEFRVIIDGSTLLDAYTQIATLTVAAPIDVASDDSGSGSETGETVGSAATGTDSGTAAETHDLHKSLANITDDDTGTAVDAETVDKPVVNQHYDDFSDYAVGADMTGANGGIPGWSPRWWLAESANLARTYIAADADARGGQSLVIDGYSSGRMASLVSLDAVDGAEVVEVVTRFFPEHADTIVAGLISHGSGTAYATNAYANAHVSEPFRNATTDRLRHITAEAGSQTYSAYVAHGLTPNTWIWWRYRIDANGMHSKVWADGTAEPTSWMVETAVPGNPQPPGWIGVGFREQPIIYRFDFVGIGINGEAAPTEPPPTEVSSSDSGTGVDTEAVDKPVAIRTITDSVGIDDAPVEQATDVTVESTDTGSATDTEAVETAAPTAVESTDTGSATDTEALTTGVTSDDAGTAADDHALATETAADDTGTATDTVTARGVADVDGGHAADTQTTDETYRLTSDDSGTATETQDRVITAQTVTDDDTNTSTVETETVEAEARTDAVDSGTGTGAESVTVTTADTDTATGADTEVVSAPVADTDDGTASDVATVTVTRASTDEAAGADTEQADVVQHDVTSTDTGTATETQSVSTENEKRDDDTGTGGDTEHVDVDAYGSDVAAAADAETVGAITPTGTDDGAGADVERLTAATTGADSGAATDEQQTARSTIGADTATGTDTAATATTVADTDTGTGADTHALVMEEQRESTDAATATETETVTGAGARDADTATATETETVQIVTAYPTGEDVGTATEQHLLVRDENVDAPDEGHGTDTHLLAALLDAADRAATDTLTRLAARTTGRDDATGTDRAAAPTAHHHRPDDGTGTATETVTAAALTGDVATATETAVIGTTTVAADVAVAVDTEVVVVQEAGPPTPARRPVWSPQPPSRVRSPELPEPVPSPQPPARLRSSQPTRHLEA